MNAEVRWCVGVLSVVRGQPRPLNAGEEEKLGNVSTMVWGTYHAPVG